MNDEEKQGIKCMFENSIWHLFKKQNFQSTFFTFLVLTQEK